MTATAFPAQVGNTVLNAGRVIWYVALLDITTRFGSSIISYIIAILWPLTHIAFILIAYLVTHAVAPVGDEPAIFAGTGILPYVLCLYPSRVMTMAVAQNKFLLQIPVIKPIHIIIARLFIEIFSASFVCVLFLFCLYMYGLDVFPWNIQLAFSAISASIYLGVGIGTIGIFFTSLFGPHAVIVVVVLMIAFYLTSGAFIPVEFMGPQLREIVAYNPVYHCVKWLRAAYYSGDNLDQVSIAYVIMFASASLALGLASERYLRGKYLS